MSDRDSLLAAVVADPDDPTPRLVFADWLDEHGDPAWAELIRLQNGYFKHWTNAAEMKQREAELVEVVMARYPSPDEFGVKLGPPVRGFPERLRLHDRVCSSENAPVARAFLAAFPITWYELAGGFPDWCVAEGCLRRAIVIDMHIYAFGVDGPYESFPAELDPADLRALMYSRFFAALDPSRLRGLIWRGNALSDEDVEHIASAPQLAGLTELCLSSNYIGPVGCDALIASPYLTRLEYLDLAGNPVGDAARRLEQRFGAALRLA